MKPDGIFGKDKSEVSYDSPPPIVKKAQSPLRPEHALIGSHHVADSLVDEFLQAFALPGFSRVDVALGVCRDAVHSVELAGLAAAIAPEHREAFLRLRPANELRHPAR